MASNLYFEINRAAIDLIVRAYRDGNHKELEQLGIPVGIAKSLANMRTCTYIALLNFRGAIMEFRSDTKRLALLIEHMEQQSDRDYKVNELLQLGATQPMLARLAAVDRAEFQRKCRLLGIDSKSCRGKPRNLTNEESLQVIDALQCIDIEDPLLRWIQLGRGTGIPLGLIWRFLNAEGSADKYTEGCMSNEST